MSRVALVAGLTLTLGVSACGSDDDPEAGNGGSASEAPKTTAGGAPNGSPKDQIQATYETYIESLYGNDPQGTCATMTPAVQKEFGAGMSCEQRLRAVLSGNAPSPNKPFIAKLKVNGAKASARVKTKTSNDYPLHFVKQGDQWKISGGTGLTR